MKYLNGDKNIDYDFKNIPPEVSENTLIWMEALKLVYKDEDVKAFIEQYTMSQNNLSCIVFNSVELVNKKGEKFNILTENLTDVQNVSLYHHYIHTPMKMEATTINKAIEKGNYIENMCWVNALSDFYSDTIMNEKTRQRLTVDC